MPRKPYLAKSPEDNPVSFDTAEIDPRFLAEIGRCIGVWSLVDVNMGALFSTLLGVHSRATLEVFATLRRASNQIEAIRVASKHALKEGESKDALDAALIVYKSLEGQRNDLAHGAFATPPRNPDKWLVWIDPKDFVQFQAGLMAAFSRGAGSLESTVKAHQESMFYYTLKDLEALRADMTALYGLIWYLNLHLQYPDDAGLVEGLRQRCNAPLIAQAVAQIRLSREQKSAAQPESPPEARGV